MASQIDREVFNGLLQMTDAGFIAQLVDTFLEDTPAQFKIMRAALAAGNAGEFRRAAHSVKSNAATFGAAGLADLARELEALAKENRLEAAGGRLAELESLFAAVARELKELNR